MTLITSLYEWFFVRIPKKFSVPFILTLVSFNAFIYTEVMTVVDKRFLMVVSTLFKPNPPAQLLGSFIHYAALLVASVVIIFGGFVLSYLVALFFFWLLASRRLLRKIQIHKPHIPAKARQVQQSGPLAKYNSIGIILAGGGAKGAYQAGAMKAIYEFLEEQKSHHKVKMIAGTSIGSWNALFWLAHLVTNPSGGMGLLEQWWTNVGVEDIVAPIPYWPFRQNYLLSNKPWQQTFGRLFVENEEAHEQLKYYIDHPDAEDAMRFYFTRTNVAMGKLRFVTNVEKFKVAGDDYLLGTSLSEIEKCCDRATSVEHIRESVFSSMDLPPLFPYLTVDETCYEDGGVVDNLPIRFGTDVEECDLLFVLPLNASFAEEPNPRSILKRLIRVMNVRQGVLERNAFKRVYRRNELMKLRSEIVTLSNQVTKSEHDEQLFQQIDQHLKNIDADSGPQFKRIQALLNDRLNNFTLGRNEMSDDQTNSHSTKKLIERKHPRVQVFAICPSGKLEIGTNEFWKTREAGKAFRRMYRATRQELRGFDFRADVDRISILRVTPFGEIDPSDDL